MKKKVICIIDFGQSHLKFILLTGKLSVARTLIIKNNFKICIKNSSFYDSDKIEKTIKSNINKLSKKFNITSLSTIAHGSGCFFINRDKKIISGFHFSSKYTNASNLSEFNKSIPNFYRSFTPIYNDFHNLGKNLFLISKENKNLEFMTIPSYLSWLFTKQNIIDYSYISCHSFLWDFKKKKLINFFIKKNLRIPKIKNSGSLIGNFSDKKNKNFKSCKFYNGMHDTSAAFSFHKNFFPDKNSIFLSTGTTFVLGKYLNKIEKVKNDTNFYCLLTSNKKGMILSRRFQGGLIYNNLKMKRKKSIEDILAKRTIRELKHYDKYFLNSKIKLIIDGYFAENYKFISSIKKYKKDIIVYCAKNKNSPSIGLAFLCLKKKLNLKKENFYNKIK